MVVVVAGVVVPIYVQERGLVERSGELEGEVREDGVLLRERKVNRVVALARCQGGRCSSGGAFTSLAVRVERARPIGRTNVAIAALSPLSLTLDPLYLPSASRGYFGDNLYRAYNMHSPSILPCLFHRYRCSRAFVSPPLLFSKSQAPGLERHALCNLHLADQLTPHRRFQNPIRCAVCTGRSSCI
jgi:hypothetical protein